MTVLVGLSLMPAEDVRVASAPLFDAGLVDALEWNVDMGFVPEQVPAWARSLCDFFEAKKRLYAHGVELSPLSVELAAHQTEWLALLDEAVRDRRFVHLTEHFGFMTAGDFVRGTPLPMPRSRAAIDLGVRRFAELASRFGGPVGIENLGFAFSADDARAQCDSLGEIAVGAEAFLLLDVHNLHCQAVNFRLDPRELARRLPLDRVREIHVAGGSFAYPSSDEQGRPFRRDSHDGDVPEPVLELLSAVLPRCPALEVVFLERTDRSLYGTAELEAFRAEYTRLRAIVRAAVVGPPDEHPVHRTPALVDDEPSLARYQESLLSALVFEVEPTAMHERVLVDPTLADYRAAASGWELRAVEMASALARQWCARKEPPGTMHAAVLRAPGLPLELQNLPIPEPGPGQVRIRVIASGVCGTDVHAFDGHFPVPLPIVLGHEPTGIVETLGEGVSGISVGDHVGVSWVQAGCGKCDACARGRELRCDDPRTWMQNGGGHAAYMIAEAAGCTVLPAELAFEDAAPLFCAGHTVMSGLVRAQLEKGDRVAIVGIGGLGHLAIQIARALGHEVLAVTSSPDKRAEARALGADHALLSNGNPGAAIDAAGGADVILTTTSSMREVASSAAGLRIGGRLVVLGLGEGPLELDPLSLLSREASVLFAVQGGREDLTAVLLLAARGLVKPRVESYPLILAHRALTRLKDGRVRYRAVITHD